jgi:hypothetical protein
MLMTALRNEAPDQPDDGTEPGEGRWSNSEILLAAALDELRQANWLYVASRAKHRPPQPVQVPRPGVRRQERKQAKPNYTLERAAILDPRLRAEHEKQMRDKQEGG